jgi:hypothetical protein
VSFQNLPLFAITSTRISNSNDDDDDDTEDKHDDDAFDSSTSSSPFDLDDLTPVTPRSKCPLHTSFKTDDCLVGILNFFTFEDLNNFSLVSKKCYNIRCHQYLDQTRSGTICLDGSIVKNTIELMEKAMQKQWHKSFQDNRRHLRLQGLDNISSDINSINGEFVRSALLSWKLPVLIVRNVC